MCTALFFLAHRYGDDTHSNSGCFDDEPNRDDDDDDKEQQTTTRRRRIKLVDGKKKMATIYLFLFSLPALLFLILHPISHLY